MIGNGVIMSALRQRVRPNHEATAPLLPATAGVDRSSATSITKARCNVLLALALSLCLCLMSSINVLKKVRHSQRIDRWGHTMVNYRNQLLQSADKEGGAMMKRQQYNQTWEELPQCVQRYLQRVAPEPLPNLKSLSYQQRGEVSLWDGRWDNFTTSGLITAGGLVLSGIVEINSAFDYHYSDVYVEGEGHRVGYQSGMCMSGILYAQNVEIRFTSPLYPLCYDFLAEGEDLDAKDINKIEGSNWLLDSVLTPSLLRPEAGVVTWKADKTHKDGKELPNSAVVTLSEKEHEQVWATATFNEEGLMTLSRIHQTAYHSRSKARKTTFVSYDEMGVPLQRVPRARARDVGALACRTWDGAMGFL